jgi:hypothetical protein
MQGFGVISGLGLSVPAHQLPRTPKSYLLKSTTTTQQPAVVSKTHARPLASVQAAFFSVSQKCLPDNSLEQLKRVFPFIVGVAVRGLAGTSRRCSIGGGRYGNNKQEVAAEICLNLRGVCRMGAQREFAELRGIAKMGGSAEMGGFAETGGSAEMGT